MQSSEIRKKFIEYFQKQGHTHVSSSSLVPEKDPTLLFTNAGMNQFKNTFLGLDQRPYSRAVSSQKCVRAGGKHNDLENVGFTARHHTFFEMLGNFSFGDYFKKDAIHFAWELLTNEFGLSKDRLYVSVYEEDDEAAEIWHKQEAVPRDRIYRFGQADNFWRMGETGPCGPCSEIYYDLGEGVPGSREENRVGGSGDRFLEIWNLVFMQFNEDEKGTLHPLPKPSVDTGAGLERLTSALQGALSNYDTDVFQPLIQYVAELASLAYQRDSEMGAAMRVLSDHARSASFLIADGVLPSNEGRGYVLRRILRRGIRYGRKLSPVISFLPQMVDVLAEQMKHAYPELRERKDFIRKTIQDEEDRFTQTLDVGTRMLEDELQRASGGSSLNGASSSRQGGGKVVPGALVFKLYDTYGFPLDLTRLMARERGFEVDESGFEQHMAQAREVAKASWKGGRGLSDETSEIIRLASEAKPKGPTVFTGYTELTTTAHVVALSEQRLMVCDRTCFYAESGGQVGDVGTWKSSRGRGQVLDCQKHEDIFVHRISVEQGELRLGDEVELKVDETKRRSSMANHSATHLLHAALRSVLGTHVKQAGSLVEPERLRFDFTHSGPLTHEELQAIETKVNGEISRAEPVRFNTSTYSKAIEDGALALFGEKYGDEVRTIRMGEFSHELCGGTHVSNTVEIRAFKIISEGGISSGVRRIEALTGQAALNYLYLYAMDSLRAREVAGLGPLTLSSAEVASADVSTADVSANGVASVIQNLRAEVKRLEKELKQVKASGVDLEEILKRVKKIPLDHDHSSVSVIAEVLDIEDREVLSQLSDRLKDKLSSGVVILIGQGSPHRPLLVSVTKDQTKFVSAGTIVKNLAQALGGKGGGRPDFAQGSISTSGIPTSGDSNSGMLNAELDRLLPSALKNITRR